MSPEDVAVVTESWAGIRSRRDVLADRLTASYVSVRPPAVAHARAQWLVDAVAELVDLLAAPSQLATRARELAATLPDSGLAPSFLLDGNAWMCAAGAISPTWSDRSAHAWRQAWLLLSEVLAEDSLSPFGRPSPASPT